MLEWILKELLSIRGIGLIWLRIEIIGESMSHGVSLFDAVAQMQHHCLEHTVIGFDTDRINIFLFLPATGVTRIRVLSQNFNQMVSSPSSTSLYSIYRDFKVGLFCMNHVQARNLV